jgi:hypothetical protein
MLDVLDNCYILGFHALSFGTDGVVVIFSFFRHIGNANVGVLWRQYLQVFCHLLPIIVIVEQVSLSNGDLLLYHAFKYPAPRGSAATGAPLRWHRLATEAHITRPLQAHVSYWAEHQNFARYAAAVFLSNQSADYYCWLVRQLLKCRPVPICVFDSWRQRFVPFADVAGRDGIFIGGIKPLWYVLNCCRDSVNKLVF